MNYLSIFFVDCRIFISLFLLMDFDNSFRVSHAKNPVGCKIKSFIRSFFESFKRILVIVSKFSFKWHD